MFIYGQKGSKECGADNRCVCTCMVDAVNGSCQQESRDSVDLYSYSSQSAAFPSKSNPTAEIPSKLHKSTD